MSDPETMTLAQACAARQEAGAGAEDYHPARVLAVHLLHRAGNPGGRLPLGSWVRDQADDGTLILAAEILAAWAKDLPPMDEPDEGDERPTPVTDEEYIARRVADEEDAAAVANILANAYNEGLPADDHLGVIDYGSPAPGAAEAILEIENHRKACRDALTIVRAELAERGLAPG